MKNDMLNPKVVSMADGDHDDMIHEHEVHSAAQDLLRAEKHKGNHKLMKKVHAHLSQQKKQINSIQDLKQMRNDMMKEDKNGFEDDVPAPKGKKSKDTEDKLGFENSKNEE